LLVADTALSRRVSKRNSRLELRFPTKTTGAELNARAFVEIVFSAFIRIQWRRQNFLAAIN
jgi:hypothetical protein